MRERFVVQGSPSEVQQENCDCEDTTWKGRPVSTSVDFAIVLDGHAGPSLCVGAIMKPEKQIEFVGVMDAGNVIQKGDARVMRSGDEVTPHHMLVNRA
jgi:hypothetical protein